MAPPEDISPDIVDSPIRMTTRGSLRDQLDDILTVIELYRDEVEHMGSQRNDDSGLKDLHNSLDELHSFGKDYYKFVLRYAPSKLIAGEQALNKIQHELLTLRPLIEQRHSPKLSAQLRIADALASNLIQQCFTSGHNQWTRQRFRMKPDTCLTFFEQTHSILVDYAYYRVPSISIPLAEWNKPWMWLGLAHELGHYTYHNIKKLAIYDVGLSEYICQKILEKVLELALEDQGTNISERVYSFQLWNEWIEEVFADVYGALILGPSYIYSLMGLLSAQVDSAEALLANDHDHPCALLRPLIQIEALRMLYKNEQFADTDGEISKELTKLEQDWKEFCKACSRSKLVPFEGLLNNIISGTQIKAALCHEQMQDVVGVLVDLLIDEKSPASTIFYRPDVHQQVKACAVRLAKGDVKASIGSLPLIFCVPIASYAWRMQSLAKNEKNIRTWLQDVVRQPIHRVAYKPVYGRSLVNQVQGDSFEVLLKNLKRTRPTDDDKAIAETLLMIEFSTQKYALGCHQCAGCEKHNKTCLCGCVDASVS